MAKVFHPSLEGAQHGSKNLQPLVFFVLDSGGKGLQPSNYHLQGVGGDFLSSQHIKDTIHASGLTLDGVSAHCPFWVHGTAWTQSPTIRPFLPKEVWSKSSDEIESWCESYILHLFDLLGELGVRIVPMFWGLYHGWEVGSGYPWGFWSGPEYDLLKAGDERFVKKTERIRKEARSRGLYLCHEIHPNTLASCADDFLRLEGLVENDPCFVVNADPSHCWAGESWETRFRKVGRYIYACHMKNHYVASDVPLLSMQPDWKHRGMQFTILDRGNIDLVRFSEFLISVGYPERYCRVNKTATAPLVVEAESAYAELDHASSSGIKFVAGNCCYDAATKSFEEGMGETK